MGEKDKVIKVHKKKTKEGRNNSFFSMKWKVVLLIFVAVILTSVINLFLSLPVVNREVSKLACNYMEDVVVANNAGIDEQMELIGISTTLSYNWLRDTIGDSAIADTPSSYQYAVSKDGLILYHPDKELVGSETENQKILDIIAHFDDESYERHGFITYREKGSIKYAAYSIGAKKQHVLLVCADESDLMSGVNEITMRCIGGAVLATLICGIVGLFITRLLINPLLAMIKEVERLASLDFSESQISIRKSNDETGLIADALSKLRQQLRETVCRISEQTIILNHAAGELNDAAEETATNVEQVETAIRGIADGSAKQARETREATENVMEMGNIIEATGSDVQMLLSNATTMLDAGEAALKILDNLDQVNKRTKDAVTIIDEQTRKTDESVQQIMQATDIITAIAEETNLLSLNASIEAARAGEAGRGFAVVATEIQKLAEQSNASATEISNIITELIAESEKSIEIMEEMKAIIIEQDQHVGDTKQAFYSVKEGIDRSITGVEKISKQTQRLGQARVKVVDVVHGLTVIAQENAESAQETSSATAEVTNIMTSITSESEKVHTIADIIQQDMDKMKME